MKIGWMSVGIFCFCVSIMWFYTAYGQHSGEMLPCFFADTMKCKMARGMGSFASLVSGRESSATFHPWLTWLSGIFMLMGLFLSANENDSQEDNKSTTINRTNHKNCPACAESIKAAAKLCRYCGYVFTDKDIEKEIQIQKQKEREEIARERNKCSNCGAPKKNNRAVKCENCNVRF